MAYPLHMIEQAEDDGLQLVVYDIACLLDRYAEVSQLYFWRANQSSQLLMLLLTAPLNYRYGLFRSGLAFLVD